MTGTLADWKRKMLLYALAQTVAGVVAFLWGVYLIRDHPVLGYVVGSAGVLLITFGVLYAKFALWGPFPEQFLPPERRGDEVLGPEDFR